MEKTEKGKASELRLKKTLSHQEPDRIPIHDFFWTMFLDQWKEEFGLAADTDPNRYFGLDMVCVFPNIDPVVQPFEILKESDTETLVKTGFGATVQKVHDFPMPHYAAFELDTIEKVDNFTFGDPWNDKRYFSAGDDHLNGVGDSIIYRNTAPFIERVDSYYPDFAVFGVVLEAHEIMVRSIGQANTLLWMGMHPEAMGRFAQKANEFSLELVKAQIKATGGKLYGILMGGDVAFKDGMLFSPDYWRQYFKPGVKAMCDLIHSYDKPVLYHGCGDVSKILDDLIEAGVDAYHPLEAKANLEMLDVRKKIGHTMTMVGNMDVRVWGEGNMEKIKPYTLRKLNAAKGGGYIFGSDHSVPGSVKGSTYEAIIKLIKEYGKYPLDLGEFDLADFS